MRSSFKVVQVDADRVFIIDVNQGMSVTNDAENVRDHINQRYPNKRLIYRDSINCWDEIVSDREGLFKPYKGYVPQGY